MKLTIKDIRDKVNALLALDRTNPKATYYNSYTTCVYTGPTGEHCIAGQLMSDLGIDVPKYGTTENTIGFASLQQSTKFDNHVVDLIGDIQWHADMGVRWNKIKDKLRSSYRDCLDDCKPKSGDTRM